MNDRRVGLEQEFFVVDRNGEPADRADALIENCRKLSRESSLDAITEDCFQPEWVKNILEIKTAPAASTELLAHQYLDILDLAILAADELELMLYPLAAYPLHLIPTIRDAVSNHVQVRTVGHERFLNAGRCTGVHVHLEVPAGTIDPVAGISYESDSGARAEVLNAYNLGTALDPILIALGRSCPFYEGLSTGLAYHTARYRGSKKFGWDGVYTDLPEVGGLRPYAESIEHLVYLQFERHFAWLDAMHEAKVETELFCHGAGGLLRSSWNPVRLNGHGTLEHRNIDSNFPQVILGLVLLLYDIHARVRARQLRVTPTKGVERITVSGDRLLVPDFECLNEKLFYAAVTEGVSNEMVCNYTESVLQLAEVYEGHPAWLSRLMPLPSRWQTTEQRLLKEYYPPGERLTKEEGLRLARETCDEFARQVRGLRELDHTETVH